MLSDDAYYLLGSLYMDMEQWNSAADAFRTGAESQDRGVPFLDVYWSQRNRVSLIEALYRMGRLDETEMDIERLLTECAETTLPRVWARTHVHYWAALLRLNQGRSEEAWAHWRELKLLVDEDESAEGEELLDALTRELQEGTPRVNSGYPMVRVRIGGHASNR